MSFSYSCIVLMSLMKSLKESFICKGYHLLKRNEFPPYIHFLKNTELPYNSTLLKTDSIILRIRSDFPLNLISLFSFITSNKLCGCINERETSALTSIWTVQLTEFHGFPLLDLRFYLTYSV